MIGPEIADVFTRGVVCPDEVTAAMRAAPLLQVCKDMQPFLINDTTLVQAMTMFAHAAVGRSFMQPEELALLGNFFTDKAAKPALADTAAACLKLIIDDALDNGRFQAEVFILLVDKVLPAIHLQDRPVGVRRASFALIQRVLCEPVLADPATGTVARLRTVLEAIDGEGDPQLVVAMFDIIGSVFTWADASEVNNIAEDFFEALASYFPVLFTQPPGCPVTKKDLQDGLARCLSHPALFQFCIPFMLGKIVSPSTVVKLDVVRTIKECVERYEAASFLDHFATDVVTHLRNEIVKMSAFPDSADSGGTSSPSSVIAVGCSVLTNISRLCGASPSSDAKIIQLFEPVNEGTVQCASDATTARHTCSAYATMLFSTLVGSWRVCLASGGYVFAMLSLLADTGSAADGKGACTGTVNTSMLFSSLCAGFADALGPEDDNEEAAAVQRNELRAKIDKALPSFLETVRSTSVALAEPSCPAAGADSDAELLALCQAELLCSVLKLDLRMAPWLREADLEQTASALVKAAVFNGLADVRASVARLLRTYMVMDPENRVQQAVQALAQSPSGRRAGDGATALCGLLECLSSSSLNFANFALEEVLLQRPADPPVLLQSLSPAARGRTVTNLLDNFDSLSDGEATSLLDRLLAPPVHAAALESVRSVFARSSEAFRTAALERAWSGNSCDPGVIMVAAALVCCGPDLLTSFPQDRANTLLAALATLLSASAEEEERAAFSAPGWREVVMNCAAGTVVCASGLERPGDNVSGGVAYAVAVMWGRCLCVKEQDASALAAIASELQSTVTAAPSHFLKALDFFPLLALTMPERGTLLAPYLAAGREGSAGQLPLYWRGLHCLLRGEDARRICACQEDLLNLLASTVRPGSAIDGELVRDVFFLLDRKGAASFLHTAVFGNATLLDMVCQGLESPHLDVRCATLNYLSSAAQVAAEQSNPAKAAAVHVPNPVLRRLLQGVRDTVLAKTEPTLADRKRLVRQAAGRCRNGWFKVK